MTISSIEQKVLAKSMVRTGSLCDGCKSVAAMRGVEKQSD